MQGPTEREDLGDSFRSVRPVYERYTAKLVLLIAELLERAELAYLYVDSRTKSVASVTRNVRRGKFRTPADLRDISALRIIVLDQQSVAPILKLLNAEFDVRKTNDAAHTMAPDTFGYGATHVTIRLDGQRSSLTDWRDFWGLEAEIQIRTELQDAFGHLGRELSHKLEEHIEAVPRPVRRRFYRLRALLEVAEDEISGVRNEWRAHLERILNDLVAAHASAPSKETLRRLRDLAENLFADQPEKIATRRLRAETARHNDKLYEYLEHHSTAQPAAFTGKPAKLMTRRLAEKRTVFPVWELSLTDVLLGGLDTTRVREIVDWQSSQVVRERFEIDQDVHNDLVFAVRALTPEIDKIIIDGGLTTYTSALIHQDALEEEILSEAAELLNRNPLTNRFEELDNRLMLRPKSYAPEILQQRHMAMSVSTLTVVPEESGDYSCLFQKRGNRTATHPGLYHVVPASMFQPQMGLFSPASPREIALETAKLGWDWRLNTVREFAEELFEEASPCLLDPEHGLQWRDGKAKGLSELLAAGGASLETTGLVMNALNLRPEICTVLIIHDREWWARQERDIAMNWEYDSDATKLSKFALHRFEAQFLAWFGNDVGQWVPPGLAALWLGVEASRRLLGTDAMGH